MPHPCQHCGNPVKKVDAPVCQRCAASFNLIRTQGKWSRRILRRAQIKSVWAKKARVLARRVLA